MTYSLGVDLGAASCAAAYRRGPDVEPCALGDTGTTMPSVVLPRRDGSMLVGEAADQACRYEPAMLARAVAGRLGGGEPLVVDGQAIDPGPLTEGLLGTTIQRAAAGGEWPGHLVLTYPLRDGGAAEPVLEAAAAHITGSPVLLVPEPIAAMAKLAHDVELLLDTTVAVLDFGGTSLDVTIVRRTATGFDLIGEPAWLPDFGGVDVDAAVLAHVESALGDLTSHVRDDDVAGMRDVRRLRAACRAAKEQLSTETKAGVEVVLPHVQTQVPITRADLERAIGDRLAEGVDLVTTAVTGAGLAVADLHVALLVGGSSRMPLLTRLVTERLGLRIVADPLPELTVSLGAALFGEEAPAAARPPAATGSTPAAEPAAAARAPGMGALLAARRLDTNGTPALGRSTSGSIPIVTTGGLPATTGFAPSGEGWEEQPWADGRRSIFDTIPPATTGTSYSAAGPPVGHAPDGADDAFNRLTTSDTDPFGTRSGTTGNWVARERKELEPPRGAAATGRRHEDDDPDDDGEEGGFGATTDPRVVVGAIAAGLVIVLVGGFALAAGTGGGGNDGIAVGNTNNILTTTTELRPDSSQDVTTTSGATTTEGTSTTEASGTTTSSHRHTTTTVRHRTSSTTAPTVTVTFPPATTPPTTRPKPPATTTTVPPTTTSTSTTTTSTTSTTVAGP